MSAFNETTIGAGVADEPGAIAKLCVRALTNFGKLVRSLFLPAKRPKMRPPIDISIAPTVRPMKIQRLFPDMTLAPLRTNGDSELSAMGTLSCASIELS